MSAQPEQLKHNLFDVRLLEGHALIAGILILSIGVLSVWLILKGIGYLIH